MKIALILLSTLCLVVALFAQDVNADAREQALAYLRKYKIPYHKDISNIITSADNKLNHRKSNDDNHLLQTVKYYRDSVAMNVDLFGEKIDRILKGLRIKLEQQHQLTHNNIEALMELLQHTLRRLELRGELTRERVFAELDKLKHKAIEKKLVTEAQWKQLVNDVAGSFTADAWYRRFLGGRYHRQLDDEDDGFHRWKNHLKRQLKHNKKLTEAQINQSLDTVQRAIHNTPDAAKLADSRWWRRVERELKRNLADPEQVKSVMDSVRDDVHAYKIFAMDYAPEEARNWLSEWYDWIRELYHEFFQWLYNQYHDENTPESMKASSSYAVMQAHSRSVDLAVQSAGSAAQSVTQAVQDTTQHWKDSFAKYWLEKEKQAYKRIGYTEAQLQWLHDHLEKTIKDRKSLAKHNVDASLYAIRRYLQEARVQSASQIEHQISRIQHLLEIWKQTLPTERVEL